MERLQLDPRLFPSGVAVRAYRLGLEVDAALERLQRLGAPEVPKELARAVSKRRLDYVAGRFCAREALGECAPELTGVPIATGPNREPLWPEGAVGSIAHTRGYVVAAAARVQAAGSVGVDIEHWLDDEAPARLGPSLAIEGELAALAQATGWPEARVLTLVFSAKESLFKCLYPQVRQYFGFQDARVTAIAPRAGEFVVSLAATVAMLPAGLALRGRFECLEAVVVTALVTAPASAT